jgi:hypothetical protein
VQRGWSLGNSEEHGQGKRAISLVHELESLSYTKQSQKAISSSYLRRDIVAFAHETLCWQASLTMTAATSYVQVQGRYLWKGGKRVRTVHYTSSPVHELTLYKFFVKGVVYQAYNDGDYSLGGRDLVSDDRLAQLQNDLHLFQELGVNTLLICKYSQSLERCMC